MLVVSIISTCVMFICLYSVMGIESPTLYYYYNVG